MSYELKARMALTKYGFHFTHSLGQNFLLDEGIIAAIADAAEVTSGDNVLEIGAGAGVLTAELLERHAHVCTVEIDRGLKPVLDEVLGEYGHVDVIFEDALKCDLNALCGQAFGGKPFKVVANLPYYITADIMLRLLTSGLPIASITVMVQKEAGERMMSHVGQKQYCALAAIIAYHAQARAIDRKSTRLNSSH